MAIATAQQVVTGEWQQIGGGDCTIQSSKTGVLYNISIGAAVPTEVSLVLKLDEPTTFAYKEPVWVRLHAKGNSAMRNTINVIK